MPAKGYQRTKVSVSQIPVELEDVQIAFAARVVFNGHTYRLSLPMKEVRFWGIETGDELLVSITKLKREPNSRTRADLSEALGKRRD
jgi:hypothetical protein